MDERLFQRLADWVTVAPVVLASVIETRGATPRKGGSRMLISRSDTAFSVGGGMAEARVIAAAHALLGSEDAVGEVAIDLTGKPGAAGVCGGLMRIALRHWRSDVDRLRAKEISTLLTAGKPVTLSPADVGGAGALRAEPDPRLLIVGGGHCAAALCDMAALLDFDLWVHDTRSDCLQSPSFHQVTRLDGPFNLLTDAFDTRRDVFVVLLNRDFVSDVATLRTIAGQSPRFLGMMGSHKRIAEVMAALPDQPGLATRIHAPIGIDVGAETPHEIAVSILAQLIQVLRA